MREIIIEPHAGGLGDLLIYSTLPRMFYREGCRVLWSLHTPIRNEEVRKMILDDNPYISGFTSKPGEYGKPFLDRFYYEAKRNNVTPTIAMERAHGFIGDHRLPYINERPRLLPDSKWKGKIVCDPHSISQPFTPEMFEPFIHWVCRWNDLDANKIIILDSKHRGEHGSGILKNNERYTVTDLREYRSIIRNAKLFLCTESGGQSLAATDAYTAGHTIALVTTKVFNDRCFIWPGIDYYVTGKVDSDF